MVNPDGTIQAAPPTMSAFSPQASPSAPPPPAQPAPVQAQQGGFADALVQMIKALMGNTKPGQQLASRGHQIDQQVNDASGLGNEFNAGR
jgi:hypothetical protein